MKGYDPVEKEHVYISGIKFSNNYGLLNVASAGEFSTIMGDTNEHTIKDSAGVLLRVWIPTALNGSVYITLDGSSGNLSSGTSGVIELGIIFHQHLKVRLTNSADAVIIIYR